MSQTRFHHWVAELTVDADAYVDVHCLDPRFHDLPQELVEHLCHRLSLSPLKTQSPVTDQRCLGPFGARQWFAVENIFTESLQRVLAIRESFHKQRELKRNWIEPRSSLHELDRVVLQTLNVQSYRFGLKQPLSVSKNLWSFGGGIAQTLDRVRESLSPTIKVEVEVHRLSEFQEAIAAAADIIRIVEMKSSEVLLAARTNRGRSHVIIDQDPSSLEGEAIHHLWIDARWLLQELRYAPLSPFEIKVNR
jgi:hypothetical protein